MNNITQKILAGEAELPRAFNIYNISPKDLREFFRTKQLELLQTIIDYLPKEKDEINIKFEEPMSFADRQHNEMRVRDNYYGYNECLAEIKSKLTEAIKELK